MCLLVSLLTEKNTESNCYFFFRSRLGPQSAALSSVILLTSLISLIHLVLYFNN